MDAIEYPTTIIDQPQPDSIEHDKGGPNGPPLSAFPFPTNHLHGSCGALTGVIEFDVARRRADATVPYPGSHGDATVAVPLPR